MKFPATALVRATQGWDRLREIEQEARKQVVARQDRPKSFKYVVPVGPDNVVMLSVDVVYTHGQFQPVEDFPYDKKTKTFTVKRGSRSAPRQFFALPYKELRDSAEYKAWQAKINAAVNELYTLEKEEVERICAGIITTDPALEPYLRVTEDTVVGFLAANGWTFPVDLPFKDFSWAGWILTSGPDGYGHQQGTAVAVDFTNKNIYVHGWSSDD